MASFKGFESRAALSIQGSHGVAGVSLLASFGTYLAAIRRAVLLALLIAYGLGFAALYRLVQASAAESAAQGNDPMMFMGG